MNISLYLFFIGAATLFALGIFWRVRGSLTERKIAALLLAFGFLLRLSYILYTKVDIRQHDVWNFSNGNFFAFDNQRHAEYIEYIATYLKLPNVNPMNGLAQTYHPPLHHLIAGLWLRLNTALGVEYTAATENIQFLTLLYSSACMVIVYRILRYFKLKGTALLLPLAIICFHPTFIIMAGSVNNDILSITLAFYAVYAALLWFREPKMSNIIKVALGVGLSMMSKLSGVLVAGGIGFLFLYKWWESVRSKNGTAKKISLQFAAFGAVCVPLGLWWQIKNAIFFGASPFYVPELSSNSDQYLGGYSFFERIFTMSGEHISNVFVSWESRGAAVNEYNPLLALLKTSVFGEFTLFDPSAHIGNIACIVLFAANVLLVALSLYAGVRCLIKYKKSPVSWGLFLVWFVIMASYVNFCFSYPQVCTQNFRYAVPTLICGVTALGIHIKSASPVFRKITVAVTVVFCIASAVAYTLLGVV